LSDGFARTVRAVDGNGQRTVALLVMTAVGFLAIWIVWCTRGQVTLFAISDSARFEVASSPHSVEPAMAGVVVENHLSLGGHVEKGDVLVVLDTRAMEVDLARETRRRVSVNAAMLAIDQELEAERGALRAADALGKSATGVAVAKARVAAITAELAVGENDIVRRQREAQVASGIDALRSTFAEKRERASADSLRLESGYVAATGSRENQDRRVRIAHLQRERAQLEGEGELADAARRALELEISRRTLRSPCSGFVADVAVVTTGVTVKEGQRIATVVPHGKLRLVAQFSPAAALGRVRVGNRAVVRLDGFPWAQYGIVEATVTQVGTEPRNGTVRVELAASTNNTAIPVAHGLTGVVEVETERSTPLSLILRFAGVQMAGAPSVPRDPPEQNAAMSSSR
jgi:membrane fusion protein (multidrug efflux system)